MNSRANIMYFIEHLCDVARKEQHLEFLRMIQRDISKIVDAVAPVDGTGAANVKVLKKVYQHIALPVRRVRRVRSVGSMMQCWGEY